MHDEPKVRLGSPFLLKLHFSVVFLCSRQSGHRLCGYIDRIYVLIKEFSQKDDDELREFCNQACESFVQRCPEAITPHIKSVSFLLVIFIPKFPFLIFRHQSPDCRFVIGIYHLRSELQLRSR